MNEHITGSRGKSSEEQLADRIVSARLDARALIEYPGPLPSDVDSGYRVQDYGIDRWPEPVGGWKVTAPWTEEWHPPAGHERLIGPVFTTTIRYADEGRSPECPAIEGGLAGVEPELIVRLARDVTPEKQHWTVDEALEVVAELYMGIEIVSSPLPTLFDVGMPGIAADFCGNGGIVVGGPVPEWRSLAVIEASCFVEGELVGQGAMPLRDGPLEAFAFLLSRVARRGHLLPAGTLVSSGTITDFHAIEPGQSARMVYKGIGEVACRMIPASRNSES